MLTCCYTPLCNSSVHDFLVFFLSNISSKTYFDYYYTPFNSLQQKGSKPSESSLRKATHWTSPSVWELPTAGYKAPFASSVPPKNRCWKMSRKGLAGLFSMSGIKCVKGDNLELPKSLQCFVSKISKKNILSFWYSVNINHPWCVSMSVDVTPFGYLWKDESSPAGLRCLRLSDKPPQFSPFFAAKKPFGTGFRRLDEHGEDMERFHRYTSRVFYKYVYSYVYMCIHTRRKTNIYIYIYTLWYSNILYIYMKSLYLLTDTHPKLLFSSTHAILHGHHITQPFKLTVAGQPLHSIISSYSEQGLL